MSIDTLSGELNIKDMIITEPKKSVELPFNPEKEIFPEEWPSMLETVNESWIGTVDAESFWIFGKSIAMAFPKRFAFQDSPRWLEMTKQSFSQRIAEAKWSELTHIASAAQLIFPEKKGEFDVSAYWDELRSTAKPLDLLVLFPTKRDEIATNEVLVEITGAIDNIKNKQSIHKGISLSNRFIELRLLFPNEFAKRGISHDEWDIMKMELQQLREDEVAGRNDWIWDDATQLICDMTVLSAETAAISDNGYQLVMSKSATSLDQNPLIPEVRKF